MASSAASASSTSGGSCVGRFSASAAAELGQHLVEEHQSPLVNCMHTQSLVGHAQVDNTVLQAARNVLRQKLDELKKSLGDE